MFTMASYSTINLILLSITIFSTSCLSQSNVSKSHPFILSITKDPATNLFYTSVGIGTPRHNINLVIDLAGENLWYECDKNYNSSTYRYFNCHSKTCHKDSTGCIGCLGPYKPGCTNTCGVRIFNQFGNFIFYGSLSEDIIFISQQHQVPGLLSTCIDTNRRFSCFTNNCSPLYGLPKISEGVIGLARSPFVLPTQLALANKLPPKFSLCLPSSNNQGFSNLVVGAGGHPLELSNFLQTTPLVVNPINPVSANPSKEYFIDVKLVKIGGHVVNLKPSVLSIDNKGIGGTKISTLSPFTELQSTVYKTFIGDYLKKASDRKLKRVESVPPFEACFDSSSVTGLGVPTIDLVLPGGVLWTIHRPNSMVMAKKNVACLAFVDGGAEPRMSFMKASIIIGGYQLQDNLLAFDLASSKLSFSSSLLLHNTSCSYS